MASDSLGLPEWAAAGIDSAVIPDPRNAFELLNPIRLALERRLEGAVASLNAYADGASGGFFHLHNPGEGKTNQPGDPSHASSATCASFLVSAHRWVDKVGDADAPWTGRASLLSRTLVHSSWSSAGLSPGNPFTIAFLLEAIHDLGEAKDDEDRAGIQPKSDQEGGIPTPTSDGPVEVDDLNLLAKSPHPDPCPGLEQCTVDDADIVAYWSDQLNHQLIDSEGGLHIKEFPRTAFLTYKAIRALRRRGELDGKAARQARGFALNQFRAESVAVSAAIDESDVFELAYAAMTFVVASDAESVTPQRRDTIRHALDQFFAAQQEDGHWPRSRALFRYPKFGMAYCYEYELLMQMLTEDKMRPYLRGRSRSLARAFAALERNVVSLDGRTVSWASGHLNATPHSPESWTAASVYHFCHAFRRHVVDEIREIVFAYAKAAMPDQMARPVIEPAIPETEFLDCPIDDTDVGGLRELLTKRLIVKVWEATPLVDKGHPLPKHTPNSAILFGPPGTSKTQLAKQIAKALGWPLLQLDPSHLTRDGFDRLHAETNLLFSMLAAAERLVVLLDEFDELVQSRDQDDVATTSRFLTTAMLPKIAELADRRRIVYILATNHLERFDEAISRQGRFDLVVPVLPPILSAKLENWPKAAEKIEELTKENHLSPHQVDVLGDLTYLEFEKFDMRLTEVHNFSELADAVERAEETSIMRRPHGDASTPDTWRDRIKEQLKRARLEHP